MVEMKIRDEEIQSFSRSLVHAGVLVNDRIEELKNCLKNVYTYGISEGDFHNNLELYVTILDSLTSQIDSITLKCAKSIMTYEYNIDNLDGDLY